ncbi:MAG: right-handed parallel beta-helix repeat-containing protein, partial [bacterium]
MKRGKRDRRIFGIISVAFVMLATVAGAREWFVDQKHPSACDTNAGVEAAPFKTIQPAVDAAKPGETVYVKAGVYSDQVKLRTFGNPYHPSTLTAWKEDRVIIGSELRELPPADQWEPIEGHKSFQVQLPEGTPDDMIVILDGKPIPTQFCGIDPKKLNPIFFKEGPPDDNKLNWAIYRISDQTTPDGLRLAGRTLIVNTGDGNPAAKHKVQQARRVEPFVATETAAYWKISKLEFAWANSGICLLQSTGILLEDCFFHDIYRPAVFGTGRMGTIRRCNFLRCGFGVQGQHGLGGVIEDNLFVQCGMDIDYDIDNRLIGCQEGSVVSR